MRSKRILALGSVMSAFGALGVFLVMSALSTSLEGPVSFVVGFFLGLVTGLGAVLALFNLPHARNLR